MAASTGSGSGSNGSGGGVSATLIVDQTQADDTVAAAAAGEVAVALLQRGAEHRDRRMTLVSVCSAKGSPGVSTFAAALAALWPQESLLADLDPAGSDLIWRYRAATGEPLDPDRGLLSLGVAVRPGGTAAGGVADLAATTSSCFRAACGAWPACAPRSRSPASGRSGRRSPPHWSPLRPT